MKLDDFCYFLDLLATESKGFIFSTWIMANLGENDSNFDPENLRIYRRTEGKFYSSMPPLVPASHGLSGLC